MKRVRDWRDKRAKESGERRERKKRDRQREEEYNKRRMNAESIRFGLGRGTASAFDSSWLIERAIHEKVHEEIHTAAARQHRGSHVQEVFLYDDCKRRYYLKGQKWILGFNDPYMILEIIYGFLIWKDNPTMGSCRSHYYNLYTDNLVGEKDLKFTFQFRVSLKNIANEEIMNNTLEFTREFFDSEDGDRVSYYFSQGLWDEVSRYVETQLNPYLLTILPFIELKEKDENNENAESVEISNS